MDPLSVLQNRIEQLEARLGLATNPAESAEAQQQGDSATTNLLNAAQNINNATAGHEKLPEAMQMASELNNYIDPNYVQNIEQSEMLKKEIVAAEPVIKHHCHCMHHCQQAAPVMESEAIQQVPRMQPEVDRISIAASEVKAQAEEVSGGVQQLAESCGAAAAGACEQLAAVAQKVEQLEDKYRRRNGLD